MVTIIPELPIHARPREALLDRAFGIKRRRKTSERLREGRTPARASPSRWSIALTGLLARSDYGK